MEDSAAKTLLEGCASAYNEESIEQPASANGLVSVLQYLSKQLAYEGHYKAAVYLIDYEAKVES